MQFTDVSSSVDVSLFVDSIAIPSGPDLKHPRGNSSCDSPRSVGSNWRQPLSPSEVGASSVRRAHNCATFEIRFIQVGSGSGPIIKRND